MRLFKKILVRPMAPEFNKEFFIDKLLMKEQYQLTIYPKLT